MASSSVPPMPTSIFVRSSSRKIVSMPSGVFRPYAGVSTAILLFTKGGTTEKIWFYDMEHDGYSLDDKRQKVAENDIPDLIDCWNHRRDSKFQQKRIQRL